MTEFTTNGREYLLIKVMMIHHCNFRPFQFAVMNLVLLTGSCMAVFVIGDHEATDFTSVHALYRVFF